MRVLVVSTLKRKISPDTFASRSRVIFQLCEGLVKKGHEVSLLGTGDSFVPGARIIPLIEKGWVDLPPVENEFLRETANLIQLSQKIIELQDEFDVVHNHTYPDFFPLIVEDKLKIPMVTTFHALYDYYMDDVLAMFQGENPGVSSKYTPGVYFVALSKAYAELYKKVHFYTVVYNGVNTDFYKFSEEKEDYLFWLGRLPKGRGADGKFLDPKGVRWAIQLARETESRLYLSGPCEDKRFFEEDVKPFLSDKIQWVGDVAPEQTAPVEKIVELFGGARAFLMTINQAEPFGLVMAEAGSCGTPVVAFNRGSVKEVIVDGKTGFVVPYDKGVEGLREALGKIDQIKPQDCRDHIVKNFSIDRMVENYEKVYRDVIEDFKE